MEKWSAREPGLFKLEFVGIRGIAQRRKCYFMEDMKGKAKCPQKGDESVKTS